MIARGKKLDGTPVEFKFEDKGLTKLPDGREFYVTMMEFGAVRVFSSTPGDTPIERLCETREGLDNDLMLAHGVNPSSVQMLVNR